MTGREMTAQEVANDAAVAHERSVETCLDMITRHRQAQCRAIRELTRSVWGWRDYENTSWSEFYRYIEREANAGIP